ncbi:hypothetical protein Pcinc_038036 [Petrolisthes cinctipes]|uniref:Uncharacterized protein n=1 Tax=Petrolisthes cinctipes TaxID=88211 RepID=A0AAE1BRB2_PETCI|nr:hypothetical protein Pcinc_038036 [Petrolisthes cinctipes]
MAALGRGGGGGKFNNIKIFVRLSRLPPPPAFWTWPLAFFKLLLPRPWRTTRALGRDLEHFGGVLWWTGGVRRFPPVPPLSLQFFSSFIYSLHSTPPFPNIPPPLPPPVPSSSLTPPSSSLHSPPPPVPSTPPPLPSIPSTLSSSSSSPPLPLQFPPPPSSSLHSPSNPPPPPLSSLLCPN